MRVLVAGFDAQDRERISEQLLRRGHQALCVGAEIAVTMAPGFRPDWVIVPPGEPGLAVREALIEVLEGAIFQIANAVDAVDGGPDERPDNQWRRDGKPSGSHRVAQRPASPPRPSPDHSPVRPTGVSGADLKSPSRTLEATSAAAGAVVLDVEPSRSEPTKGAAAAELPHVAPTDSVSEDRRFAAGTVGADLRSVPEDVGLPLGRREPTLTAPDLAAKLEQVRFGDYHCILEVSRAASPFLVREHFDALSRLYNPTGWPHRLSAEEVHHLAEIGQGLREALSILGHPELRMRYESATAQRAR